MTRSQSIPIQSLILNPGADVKHWNALTKLPPNSGVILLYPLEARVQRRLRRVAAKRNLKLYLEGHGEAARIHNQYELTKALLKRTELVLISPINPTLSHPDWEPLPRMRAATLARLASRRAVALGGMNAQCYAKIAPLGFLGWAGISAFKT